MKAARDDYDIFFVRERARHRAKLKGQGSLWRLALWATDRTEEHHQARAKFGDVTVPLPVSLHRELTRRQVEEHLPDQGDAGNASTRKGRLLLGVADLFEAFAYALRAVGEALIESGRALNESDFRLQGLRRVLPAVEATIEVVIEALRGPSET